MSTILVVEDAEDVREITVDMLESLGYSVLEVENAASALAVLEKYAAIIDLVITDVVMPGGMSGIEFANAVEANHEGIRIVLTSGYPQDEIHLETTAKLARSFIPKPFDGPDLVKVVQEALESR